MRISVGRRSLAFFGSFLMFTTHLKQVKPSKNKKPFRRKVGILLPPSQRKGYFLRRDFVGSN